MSLSFEQQAYNYYFKFEIVVCISITPCFYSSLYSLNQIQIQSFFKAGPILKGSGSATLAKTHQ